MKNKHNIFGLILSILISTLFMTSCKDEIVLSEGNEETLHTVKMTLNGSFIDYDGTSTRASSREWKNGETLYLRFLTSNGFIDGKAVYDDSSIEGWIVSFYGTLDRNSEMWVNVCFFDNPSLKTEDNILKLTPTTPCYWSLDSGTAVYSQGEGLTLTATLQPIGGRIRFKGSPGEDIAVGGITYNDSFELNPYALINGEDFVYLTVNESGYTDYLYSAEFDTEQIKINKQEEEGSFLYTLDCTENMLATGKSGWLNIPTQTNRNGWNRKQVSGEENGYLWIDLGLPSGTKWAADNVGADIAQWQEDEKESNVYGEKYVWGQTTSSDQPSYENVCREDIDIQGSDSYDTAKWIMKGKWVMPSYEDYKELLEYCKFKLVDNAYGTINTIEVSGSTGEFIDFPYDKNNNNGTWYWTSSSDSGDSNTNSLSNTFEYYAYIFSIGNSGIYELTSKLSLRILEHSMPGGGIGVQATLGIALLRAVIKGNNSYKSLGVYLNNLSVEEIESFPPGGGTSATYEVRASGEYSISKDSNDSWYTVTHSKENNTFFVTATQNLSGKERQGEITVALSGLPAGESKEVKLKVSQSRGLSIIDPGERPLQ